MRPQVGRRFLSTTSADSGTNDKVPSPPPANEKVEAATEEEHTFQAETAQLLNIVAKSLYTDKEVPFSRCADCLLRFTRHHRAEQLQTNKYAC